MLVFTALALSSWAVPIIGAAHCLGTSFTRTPPRPATGVPIPAITAADRERTRRRIPLPVQFREQKDRGLLVSTWINGAGPYTFAIDTGAGTIIVNRRVAFEAKLPQRGSRVVVAGLSGVTQVSGREAVINTVALGQQENILSSNRLALVSDGLPSDIDGVLDPTEAYWPLGYSIDIPKNQMAVFDPRESSLRISDSPRGGAVVPWVNDSDSRRPFVRLGDGRLALIDTGSGFGFALDEDGLTRGPGAPRPLGPIKDIGGGAIAARRVRPSTITIGALTLRGVPTDLLSGMKATSPIILGRAALYPFKLTFDPVKHLIEIAPTLDSGR